MQDKLQLTFGDDYKRNSNAVEFEANARRIDGKYVVTQEWYNAKNYYIGINHFGMKVEFNLNKYLNIPYLEPMTYEQMRRGIIFLNEEIANDGIDIDLWNDGKIKRQDFNFDVKTDFQFSDYVPIYSKLNSRIRNEKHRTEYTTEYYGNTNQALCIYDKQEEHNVGLDKVLKKCFKENIDPPSNLPNYEKRNIGRFEHRNFNVNKLLKNISSSEYEKQRNKSKEKVVSLFDGKPIEDEMLLLKMKNEILYNTADSANKITTNMLYEILSLLGFKFPRTTRKHPKYYRNLKMKKEYNEYIPLETNQLIEMYYELKHSLRAAA